MWKSFFLRDSVGTRARLVSFVIPLGLEPKAYCLEGSCSIQLSYGTSLHQQDMACICGCKGSHFL